MSELHVHGEGYDCLRMTPIQVIEAGINLLLAVKQAPENAPYAEEIDREIEYQIARKEEVENAYKG
jgi:hypothetical protein